MISDPYMNNERSCERLLESYNRWGSLIVAVDFDDTIYDCHKQGFIYGRVINCIKRCNKNGLQVVIFTANQNEQKVLDYCKKIGIKIEGINKNLVPKYDKSKKIYYHILLDDKAGLKSAFIILDNLLDIIETDKGK